MKPIHVMFVLLLIIAGIVLFVLMSVPPENAAGMPHPSIARMRLGGDGAARLGTIGDAPFYFQAAVILLAGVFLYMGVAEHRRTRAFMAIMAGLTGFALFVWWQLYSSYQAYLDTGETDIVFGFPLPTTWMFWGIWGSFALFNLFYVVAFRRYFLPIEDEKAFHDLVEDLKAGKGGV